MANLGPFETGSPGNIWRGIEDTPLIERFKVSSKGELEYRVDLYGVNPRAYDGHLVAENLGAVEPPPPTDYYGNPTQLSG